MAGGTGLTTTGVGGSFDENPTPIIRISASLCPLSGLPLELGGHVRDLSCVFLVSVNGERS